MGKFFADLDEELDLYVSQAAWLNTTPDKPKDDKSEEPEVSRREALRKKGNTAPRMPDCEAYYLVTYLFEIGPTVINGMGESPVTQTDISHFQSNTGIELNTWEARNLRRLSMVYLSAAYQAKAIDAPAPWQKADYANLPSQRKSQTSRDAIRALASL